jgi:dTDP-4-amino-4,6-dideoxygalactose transaminase
VNSRLDEMQAAVLRARLPLLAAGNARRRAIAARYRAALAHTRSSCRRNAIPVTCITCFRSSSVTATRFQAHLAAQGIGTLVHYPIRCHARRRSRSTRPPRARSPIACMR